MDMPKKTAQRIKLVLRILLSNITSVTKAFNTGPHRIGPCKLLALPKRHKEMVLSSPEAKINTVIAVIIQRNRAVVALGSDTARADFKT